LLALDVRPGLASGSSPSASPVGAGSSSFSFFASAALSCYAMDMKNCNHLIKAGLDLVLTLEFGLNDDNI
jgi:hypothetical protein